MWLLRLCLALVGDATLRNGFAMVLLSSRVAGLFFFNFALVSSWISWPVGCAALSSLRPEPASCVLKNVPIFTVISRIPADDTDLSRIAGR